MAPLPGYSGVRSTQPLIASIKDLVVTCRNVATALEDRYDGAPDSRTLWLAPLIQELNKAAHKAEVDSELGETE